MRKKADALSDCLLSSHRDFRDDVVDLKRLELSTSRMRTERSTVWGGSIPPKMDRKKTKEKEKISNKWDNVIVSHGESHVNPFSGCYLHLLGRVIRLASILFTPQNGKSKFIVDFRAGCSHPYFPVYLCEAIR